MRVIKVYSTVGASGEVVTNVETLRELKPILTSKGIDITGMKLVVGETRNELSIDEAVLPTGDFKLYLMPQKTKSGSLEDQVEEVESIVYRIEGKLDTVLSILQKGVGASSSPSLKVLRSAEDEAAMRDMAALSGENREW